MSLQFGSQDPGWKLSAGAQPLRSQNTKQRNREDRVVPPKKGKKVHFTAGCAEPRQIHHVANEK